MNIFIIAGDPSGDEYGAELMKNMLIINPNIQFNGIGGSLMKKHGLKSIVSFHKMAIGIAASGNGGWRSFEDHDQ